MPNFLQDLSLDMRYAYKKTCIRVYILRKKVKTRSKMRHKMQISRKLQKDIGFHWLPSWIHTWSLVFWIVMDQKKFDLKNKQHFIKSWPKVSFSSILLNYWEINRNLTLMIWAFRQKNIAFWSNSLVLVPLGAPTCPSPLVTEVRADLLVQYLKYMWHSRDIPWEKDEIFRDLKGSTLE